MASEPVAQTLLSISTADIYIYHTPSKQPEVILQALSESLPKWQLSPVQILSRTVFRIPATPSPSSTPDSLRATRLSLNDLETEHELQIAILPSSLRSPEGIPKLAVFDLDSTLVAAEVIDELARSIGVMPAVAAITERAMDGEIDFAESLRLRVSLLKGVEIPKVWDDLKSRIQFMPGVVELCRALRRLSVRIAVFSGGFVPMATWVAQELGIERVAANQLISSPATAEISYEHLTGELNPHAIIVTAEKKREFLKAFAAECDVPLNRVLCVGDGANDLLMLGEVWQAGGLAVAFRAKDRVQKEAGNRYNGTSLKDLLFLFGKNDDEITSLTSEEVQRAEKVTPKLMPGLRLETGQHGISIKED